MSTRLETILDRMQIRPSNSILEIGCGHGIAADLICQRLSSGRLVAIDRSAKMIAAASRRNARHVTSGIAQFLVSEMEDFDPGDQRFDIVLAIRVGLFHREAERARSIVSRWLKPKGRIIVDYDEPVSEPRARASTKRSDRDRRRLFRA